MNEKLEALLEYVKADGRICPMPDYWNQLWEMLPDKKRVGVSWEPSLPLILAAWWDTPYLAKILRFHEHIHYAAEHGVLDDVDTYLRSLTKEQWFYGN
ncbi:MAG: hypothetical protein KA473_08310 [Anaerolineales bacterium]|nr:hypothetical protein [Anaerolineales bacterium]MBP6209432.1 hypothetical protein [Anaerolineales bacterium]